MSLFFSKEGIDMLELSYCREFFHGQPLILKSVTCFTDQQRNTRISALGVECNAAV